MALQSFEGALVIVSHDRHLLDTTVDQFMLVADGQLSDWDGDLDDYARWLRERQQTTTAPPENKSPTAGDARQKRRDAAERRARLKPLRDKVKQLESKLAGTQRALDDIGEQLADGGLYEAGRKEELADLLQRQGELRVANTALEEELLEAMEELETAETT